MRHLTPCWEYFLLSVKQPTKTAYFTDICMYNTLFSDFISLNNRIHAETEPWRTRASLNVSVLLRGIHVERTLGDV